ncbi:MAG TPA: basic amino acid ABC transporter substrate-binding protein [Chloroflexi bacterium]|nr:basic amino acid ABC transporter substrate-binding protein [Chloroflexota bacterium]
MKLRVGALITVLMVVGLILTACGPQTPAETDPVAADPEDAQPAPADETGLTVVIATDAAFPPMEFVDENRDIVGFDIDMMDAIAAEMGFEVEYKNTAWDGIFAGLESGDYNAILSSVTINEDRLEVYDFSDPYINAGQAVVVRADETEIGGHEDLAGKTVGAQIGTTGALAIEGMDDVTLKEYDTIDLALLDLTSGNVDAVVVDTPVAADFALASDQFEGQLKIVGEAFTDEFYGVVVRKGEMGDFLSLFNEGLGRIQADGTYDEIYARWISGE